MERIIRTSEKVGRFYVYRCGELEWWRCPHGFGPEWYVCKVDENGDQVGDGDYVGENPAENVALYRRYLPC